jgi:uncharacterized protein (TIGR03086 family)
VTAGHDRALELLERALAYTRTTLSSVGPDRSGPTPCAGWSLADLLGHMDDGLDAFLEAAGGTVRVEVPRRAGADLEGLQRKACHLLGVWSGMAPSTPSHVMVGDQSLPTDLLVSAAGLEIAVHGWDVAQATGLDHPLPDDLARDLLPVARRMVADEDRAERFAAPVQPAPGSGRPGQLLGFLGRTRRPLVHS